MKKLLLALLCLIPLTAHATNISVVYSVTGNYAPVTGLAISDLGTGTANSLMGYNSSGNAAGVTVGSGLSLSGGTLTASGGAGTVTTTGSPASGNLAKFSGATSIVNGDLSGDVTTSGTLATTVAKIAGTTVSGTTGTTNAVFSNSPTLVTPALGAATVTSINGLTISSSTGTLAIANAKTLTASNSVTLAGTDGSTITFGAGGTVEYSNLFTAKGQIRVGTGSNATAALPPGADGTVLSANSNDSNGVTYQQAGLTNPGYVSGRWWTGPSFGSFGTSASSAGGTTAYVTPFYVSQRKTFTDIGVWTTAATGTKFHMAIYSGLPIVGQTINLVPGSDVEITSISTGAMDSATFSPSAITLDKGWYGLEVFPNGTMTMNTLSTNSNSFILGHTDLNTTAPKIGATGQTYGTLNSITIAITNDGSGTYAVGLKAQ